MAQVPVRLNTQDMSFPMLIQQSGRTVISSQGDLTYVPGVSTDGDVPQDRGVPSLYYAHNVLPSTQGWQSVGYNKITEAVMSPYSKANIAMFLAVDATNINYQYDLFAHEKDGDNFELLKSALDHFIVDLRDNVIPNYTVDLRVKFWGDSPIAFEFHDITAANIETIRTAAASATASGMSDWVDAIDGIETFFANKTMPEQHNLFVMITGGSSTNNDIHIEQEVVPVLDSIEGLLRYNYVLYSLKQEASDSNQPALIDNTPWDGIPVIEAVIGETEQLATDIFHKVMVPTSGAEGVEFWDIRMVHGATVPDAEEGTYANGAVTSVEDRTRFTGDTTVESPHHIEFTTGANVGSIVEIDGTEEDEDSTIFQLIAETPADIQAGDEYVVRSLNALEQQIPPVATNVRTYIAKVRDGDTASLYALDRETLVWKAISNSPVFDTYSKEVWVANVRGYSYICVENTGVAVYDVERNYLWFRDLKGIDDDELKGVVATNGYLIGFTSTRVLWSSVVDVEDFVPDEITGAGGGGVEEAEGIIVAAVSTLLGFIIFTDTNAVSVTYSGNENFPFNFKKIPSVGGIHKRQLVGDNEAGGYTYAFTTNGIQRITHNQSNTMMPNVSDFVDGNIFETYDEETGAIVQTTVPDHMQRRLTVVGNRYIVVSYSPQPTGNYHFAIVIDLVQKRMGKLKLHHTACFEYRTPVGGYSDNHGEIAFLTEFGEIYAVNTDLAANDGVGVMMIGKLQLARQRMMQLQRVEVENIRPGVEFELFDLISYDGKTFNVAAQGYKNNSTDTFVRDFLFSGVGVNHTLLFQGTFNVLSLVVHGNLHGRA